MKGDTMIQTFLTIDEAAEKLKDRGYTYEIIQALAAEGKVPWHVRDMVMVIPFPEADPFFPLIVAEKPTDPPAQDKPKTAPKGTAKKSRA
jgi:hypothetical protein